ncbi:unnamed protein product [Thlaspi arvense]|uniref:DUF1216 domain-containing protein n=1 Tax=Thlaspi arvense TaxID=13288 RepID=A0AAU9S1B9_THLAR|nr:unnamed protein product [Thlaspi arvense]
MIQSMVKWTRGVGVFVKMASENEGRSIDLSSFGIDYDTSKTSTSKRSLSETRGTFSLPHFLKDIPKMSKDFESFAYDGMLDFLASLEVRCPATTEFKNFFAKVEDYMTCFKSGSIDIIKVDISDKSEELFRAMSLLDGGKTGTSVESWRMIDGMLSIGKLLAEMNKNDSKEITFDQRKEIIGTMVKWARAIGLFVKTASEKNGKSIDLSSFGIDYAASPFKGPTGEL